MVTSDQIIRFFPVTMPHGNRSLLMTMDKKIFNQLLAAHRNRVYSYALYCLRNAQDAEDVTQEAFLRLWRSGPEIEGPRLKSWLTRVVHNLCIDETRRRKSLHANLGRPDSLALEGLVAPVTERNDPEQALRLEQKQRMLLDAMATLPPETRSVMLLHYFQGMKLAEIAETLGKKLSSVKVQIHRARKSLRLVLDDLIEAPQAPPPEAKRETG